MSDAAPHGRVVLLVTSPRVAPGLLTWSAWSAVASEKSSSASSIA